MTGTELNNYLAQGCAFIPASGQADWGNGGEKIIHWSSTEFNEYNAYTLFFNGTKLFENAYYEKDQGDHFTVRLVRE